MRDYIQMNTNKNSKHKQIMLIFCAMILLSIIAVVTVMSVKAYFTATAKKEGTLTFGTIEVGILDSSNNPLTTDNFETAYLQNILPGSVLNLKNIKIKNSGTHEEYVLVNLDVSIAGANSKTLHYNEWFNVAGEQVDVKNMATNATEPTLIASGSTATTYMTWTVPGDPLDNDFQGSTATVKLSAFGTQTFLPDSAAYVDKELYASYFIVKNASSIAQYYGTTYTGLTPTTDPLRKMVAGKNLFNINGINSGYGDSTYEISNNTVTITATGTIGAQFVGTIITNFDRTAKYTISYKAKKLVAGSAGGPTLRCTVYGLANDGTYVNMQMINKTPSVNTEYSFSYTFTGYSTYRFYFYNNTSTPVTVGEQTQYYDIQIEQNTYATTYEAYAEAVDTYDLETNTVTRNVGKMEFTGTESWTGGGINTINERYMLMVNNLKPSTYAITNICTTDNANAWSGTNFVFQIDGESRFRYYRPFVANYLKEESSELNWKNYLAEQYANGTPVTVWYVLTTPTTETVFVSKNLYDGPQYLKNTQNATDNNVSASGGIKISKDTEKDIQATTLTRDLGGELFNYVYDKPLTFSCWVKLHTDDVRTNSRMTIHYKNAQGNAVGIAKTTDGGMPADGEWHYYNLTLPAISSYSRASEVTYIMIWLSDYSQCTYSHVEIRDIQIEVGESPTDFETYDPTVYKKVNGVALREVNGVKDTYNASTKTITRNIGELELTGLETVWGSEGAVNSVYRYNFTSLSTYSPAYFNAVCSHYKLSRERTFSNIDEECFAPHPSNIMICFFVSYSTKTEWLNYLKAEKAKGNPVTVWYVRTPATETLS